MGFEDAGDDGVQPGRPLLQRVLLLQRRLEVLLQPLHHPVLAPAHPRGLLLPGGRTQRGGRGRIGFPPHTCTSVAPDPPPVQPPTPCCPAVPWGPSAERGGVGGGTWGAGVALWGSLESWGRWPPQLWGIPQPQNKPLSPTAHPSPKTYHQPPKKPPSSTQRHPRVPLPLLLFWGAGQGEARVSCPVSTALTPTSHPARAPACPPSPHPPPQPSLFPYFWGGPPVTAPGRWRSRPG